MIQSMYDDETEQFGPTIRTLSMAVGLILIIACVNVAGLMLARGATRDVELAIRASIGAGRGRLVRQLLTESLVLAIAGALIGVLLAYASLDSLVALIPLSLPANSPVAINGTVLAFALGLTVATALLFGLVPALKLSRAPKMISTMLSVGGRSGAPLSKRAGQWLIGVEIALALSYGPVLALAILGGILARRQVDLLAPIYLLALSFALVTAVFWAHTSHRSYLDVYMQVLAPYTHRIEQAIAADVDASREMSACLMRTTRLSMIVLGTAVHGIPSTTATSTEANERQR